MRMKRLVVTAGAAAALLIALPATAASAGTAAVGGGLWDHGVGGGKVYSKYHHATKYHSATACNGGLLNQCSKAVAAKGKWANASLPRNIGGGNTAYWNTY
jgi:lactococcin 972 family bacteriocin